MNFFKYIFILYFSFFLINEIHAFTDNDGKGAQSTGREDLSFLNVNKKIGLSWVVLEDLQANGPQNRLPRSFSV